MGSAQRMDRRMLVQARGSIAAIGSVGLLAAAAVAMSIQPAFAVEASEAHAHHHHVIPDTKRSLMDYVVPDVKLVRDDGKAVRLGEVLNDGKPVVLSFIYTSCTTVCPVTSQALSELQSRLGAARDSVQLVSISIDPEHDTPERLREYAKRFGAGPGWRHYTGTPAASRTAQQAFGVYRCDKMSHAPATLVRTWPGAPWVRLDGFATPDQLMAELSFCISK
jgi:protein SCO1